PNGIDHVLVLWATLALGAIAVGLNGWWTPAELRYGLDLTEPRVAFGAGRPLERLREASGTAISLDTLRAEAETLAEPPVRLPDVEIGEDDPAAIMFTSGTTGRPKGATLSHRNIV